jgi:predicted NUDIX family NTP pyrophosphohydrolase
LVVEKERRTFQNIVPNRQTWEVYGMSRKSAGLLLYRETAGLLEVLLVHPGGPFWARKDENAWSIPKGEIEGNEDPLEAAKREFEEETGFTAQGEPVPLEHLRQPGGKLVYAWAMRRDLDPAGFRSNTFTMEWPPKSGRKQEFPEIDKVEWFPLESARRKILKSQAGFLTRLEDRLAHRGRR